MVCITLGLVFASAPVTQASSKKVNPLKTVTTLSKSGVVSKAKMATLVGKKKTYQFKGTAKNEIHYTWAYQGAQVKNPVKQNLNVTFKTTGLDSIKKAANQATEAAKITIHKMQLAGAPTLTVQLPTNWQADKVVLVKKVNHKLKKVANANATIETTAKQTTLTFRVYEANTSYYLVGGKTTVADVQGDTTKNTIGSAAVNQASGEAATSANTTSEGADSTPASGATEVTEASGNAENAATASADSQSDAKSASSTKTVTFSISSATILNNMAKLPAEKKPYVPSSGWIVAPTQVSFKTGDSVYDLLVKVTKDLGIQMESKYTPLYSSYYVSGIHQLYEFDAGSLSGWMYAVNGWCPNYGCSKYTDLHDGDTVTWNYTCDLGKDLGQSYSGN